MEQLQKILDKANMFDEVKLQGEIRLELPSSGSFFVGKSFSRNFINITKPNLVIDGSGAVVRVDITEDLTSDTNIFFISSMAKNVQINNLNLYIYCNAEPTLKRLTALYNTAYGLKLRNCHIEVVSERQTNLTAVFNNGNLDTHMETRADNLVVENCHISARVNNEGEKESETYGIYNNLANSISVQNSFIYSTNNGFGEHQRAVGVYTNGRFGRFVGDNIKANGSHNTGKLKERAYAFGFVNEGVYNLISSNNIVGEWGGTCVGLENKGDFAKVNGNKILATHTIRGRSVRNFGSDSVFDGNILTSTSRNPRLFQHEGKNCIIANNLLEGLIGWWDYQSSCGIYAPDDSATDNIIAGNIVKNISDCGIYTNRKVGVLSNNMVTDVENCDGQIKQATTENTELRERLDESHIKSIEE